MIAPNISIPPGLEEAYYNIVRVLGGVNPDTIISKKGSPAKKNYSVVGARSLFVKWQDLYNGLSSARHDAWTAYWLTLPFGSHGGLHGYPGSGFSAFVYVNAPRYQLGLELLLDPPSSDLIFNGNFALGVEGWVVTGSANISSERCNFIPLHVPTGHLEVTSDHRLFFAHSPVGYRFSFDYSLNSAPLTISLHYLPTDSFYFVHTLNGGVGHYSFDFYVTQGIIEGAWSPAFNAGYYLSGFIDNVSIVRL